MTESDSLARYQTLLETARRFGQVMDLNSLIHEILDRSREVMRAEGCSLLLPDAQTEELVLHTTQGDLAHFPERPRIPSGEGIAGTVFLSHQPLNIKDARHDTRHYRKIDRDSGLVTRALLTIPLLEGSECLGVMQALNPVDREYFDDQDLEIFFGFGGLIVNALLRLEAQRNEIEQAEARQELQLAREIQESFLPPAQQTFPFAVIHQRYFPARHVSGDFYFVHRLDQDRLLCGLGDVTGKGIPAALNMARVTAMIEARAASVSDSLGVWVGDLNDQLTRGLRGGHFICLTILLANTATETVTICAAGLFPPATRRGEVWENLPVQSQLPLGIKTGVTFQTETFPLTPGELILLYSDGIPEARAPDGKELSVAGFIDGLSAVANGGQTLATAVDHWQGFVGNAPQHDDASLFLLEWRGPRPPSELSATCCPENLAGCRTFIEQWARYAGYDHVTSGQIVMACDEANANIWRHAYDGEAGPVTVRVSLEPEKNEFVVELIDSAGQVDPAKVKGRNLSDLRPGGLGTVIVHKVFDQVRYEPCLTGNHLILRKRLPSL